VRADASSCRSRTLISRDSIVRTHGVIRPHLRRTPVIATDAADWGLGSFQAVFKLEMLQRAGSFKTRGAFANLLLRVVPPAGVVAASGGNHGVAVAYAAQRLGVRARVFVPAVASPAKVARIRACGAELTVTGERYADALAASQDWAAGSGAMPIHAFDQVETLLGQGTLGLELAEQVPQLDTLLVAVGGGGLLGGLAAWYEGRVRLIGVESEAAPTLTRALAAGCPVEAEAGGIAADSLAPRKVGELMLPLAQRYAGRVLLVSDEAIRAAQRSLWDTVRVVTEPGAAAPFAALLSGLYTPGEGERVGIVLSGANTTAVDFADHGAPHPK
jgi:threonine dehydratase